MEDDLKAVFPARIRAIHKVSILVLMEDDLKGLSLKQPVFYSKFQSLF